MCPMFSIIIPVYNVAPYLRECLDSVLAQTFTDWEAICVDDGSTDGSGSILDEYATRDPRFRIIHQSNAGVGAARNRALDIATGEWITFLDGDDKIAKFRLANLNSIIASHEDVDWIHELFYEANSKADLHYTFCEKAENVFSKSVLVTGWELLKTQAYLCTNTYRRKPIINVRFPVGVSYAEDDIFALRCLSCCRVIVTVDFCGYWYRDDRAGSASRNIEVENSVSIHKLLLQTVNSQKQLIGNEDMERFSKVFSQMVRKDFNRVFYKLKKAPRSIRKKHGEIALEIGKSPLFNAKYVQNCRIGYAIYMKTGWLLPMAVQDLCKRALAKIFRCALGWKA